jgi:hypothetical protein
MAKNIRIEDSDQSNLMRIKYEIVVEALRQEESCLYTSTAIYAWLKIVKRQHAAVVLLPVVFTALAGFAYLKTYCQRGPWRWLVSYRL